MTRFHIQGIFTPSPWARQCGKYVSQKYSYLCKNDLNGFVTVKTTKLEATDPKREWTVPSPGAHSFTADSQDSNRKLRGDPAQSCPWVHFVWLNPTQPNTSSSDALLYTELLLLSQSSIDWSNCHGLTLSLFYFFWSVSGTNHIGRKIKCNCLMQPKLI